MTRGVPVGDYRLEEMCKHGFATPVDCPICKGEVGKPTPSQMVFMTENGSAYHYSRNCQVLLLGQAEERDAWLANDTVNAWEQGLDPVPIEQVSEDLIKNNRPACGQCLPKGQTGR